MFRGLTRHRLGRAVGHTRSMLTNLDKGIRTAHRVFNVVKDVAPDGNLKSAAQRGFSDYEMVKEKVRNSGFSKMGDVVATSLGDPIRLMWHAMCLYLCDDLSCSSESGCCRCSCASHAHEIETEDTTEDKG